MEKLRGTFVVMVTPFTQDEQLDEKAKALFFKMLPLLSYLEEGQLLAKVKDAMNLIGCAGGKPRKPFLPITEELKAKLQKMMRSAGLL